MHQMETGIFCGFYLSEVLFPGFLSHSDGILARFELGKFFLLKEYLFVKNLTDFHKKVEAGVDPLAPDREILS